MSRAPHVSRLTVRLLVQLMVVLSVTAGASAWAQPAVESAQTRRQVAELQAELKRVNTEIKALKEAPRSLSVDYRLRQNLADAEALGRKLSEAEAKLRVPGTQPMVAPMGPAPTAALTDGPSELAAKADILLDQAQKLTVQADRIEARVARERVRGTLRSRTRHLEQDPFVTLEGAKRSVALSRTETKTTVLNGRDEGVKGVTEGDALFDSEATPPGPQAPVAGAAGSPSPTSSPSTPRGPQAPEPTTVTTTSVSLSFRALLDARALAEVERIETSGDPQARAKALTAAVASLRKQARELQAKAIALRNTK